MLNLTFAGACLHLDSGLLHIVKDCVRCPAALLRRGPCFEIATGGVPIRLSTHTDNNSIQKFLFLSPLQWACANVLQPKPARYGISRWQNFFFTVESDVLLGEGENGPSEKGKKVARCAAPRTSLHAEHVCMGSAGPQSAGGCAVELPRTAWKGVSWPRPVLGSDRGHTVLRPCPPAVALCLSSQSHHRQCHDRPDSAPFCLPRPLCKG